MNPKIFLALIFSTAALNAADESTDKTKPPKPSLAQTNAYTQDGIWKPIAAVLGGVRLPKASLDAITLKISGEQYEVVDANEDHNDKGAFKLDTGSSPKRMTITSTNGPNAGKVFLAIYEMKDANSMRVCYDLSGRDFPKEFKAPKGSQFYLVGYRRQKEQSR